MGKKRVFVSFDFDHDDAIKTLLVGQSKNADSPFELADWSVKEHLKGDWVEKARAKIRASDLVVVLCGEHTDTAKGVSAELTLAREEKIPYFLLKAYSEKKCVAPIAAASSDKIYLWTWDNLKKLIGGAR